jgi:hypothetical protein
MRNKTLINIVILVALLIGGCGGTPSATTIPTSAPTPAPTTPPPTPVPTPTPVPYNLNVMVKNPGGQPISGASLRMDKQTITTGDDGSASFEGLASDQVSLQIFAQGYLATELSQPLQPGNNQVEVTLETDPFGLLPENACGQGETLLYIEDFQDGQGQGWDSLEAQAPGWSVEPDPGKEEGNLVLASRKGNEWATLDPEKYSFDNTAWRLHFKFEGKENAIANWRLVPGSQRYMIVLGGGQANLTRNEGNQFVEIGPAGKYAGDGWHLLEIGSFNGTVNVYLDGEKGIEYQDPKPWKGGTIALEKHLEQEGVYYYDDMSVCGLSAPFQPLPRPKTGFDLSLSITDAEGKPISSAQASIAELGSLSNATQVSDEHGKITWNDLPGESVTLSVSAPGYKAVEQILTLQKGAVTEQSLSLELDPFGLLPERACAPGEKLLYSEDFQDGKAQGWPNISAAAELNAQNGWAIVPDESGNLLLSASNSPAPANDDLGGFTFDNAVWRIKIMISDFASDAFLNWRHSFEQGDWRYFVPFGGQQRVSLVRFTSGNGVDVARSTASMAAKKWYFYEVSTYNGVTEAWLNGKKLFSYTDPQPLPAGTIGLEVHLREGVKTVFYFDDLSVCELEAPFTPLPPP